MRVAAIGSRRFACAVGVLALAAACGARTSGAPTSPAPVTGSPPVRVLVLTATAGFRHDAIPTARQVLSALAASSGASR